MHLPRSIKGMFFASALVGLLFGLEALCPVSAGTVCFADRFATPIFLPLVALYNLFGYAPEASYQELTFVTLYWAAIGFLAGLMLDLWAHGNNEKQMPNDR